MSKTTVSNHATTQPPSRGASTNRRTINIDPVTRIEGHARVFLNMDDEGGLESAGLVVNELRGFERILVGMEASRMPLITSRICGVCPTAHHLAAVKALDAAAGVTPPPAAKLLRELMLMGHFIHSHALSLFVLQGPDLVMGLDADPAVRNVVGVAQAVPEVAKKALRLRSIGQKINEMIGGRGTHPVTAVPGGITFDLDEQKLGKLKLWSDEAQGLVGELAAVAKELFLKQIDHHPALLKEWVLPVWSMGTIQDGRPNFYDGTIRVVNPEGNESFEFQGAEYARHLKEVPVDWSYMKPVFLDRGGELQTYRVGTLARINCADTMGTPLAEKEFRMLREGHGSPCHRTVMQIYARVIELVFACERSGQILDEPEIRGETRVPATFSGGRGTAHVEAPRGTLFHDYEIDERGIVRSANLLVATQQNYTAINKSLEHAAGSHVLGKGDEALLNAVEFAIRCYDPCLSCATHAMGQMPLEVSVTQAGQLRRTIKRELP